MSNVRATRELGKVRRMPDSLLDSTLAYCRAALGGMPAGPGRDRLSARLGTLEHSAEALPVVTTDSQGVIRVAKLALDLRDEIVSARS